MELRNKPAQFLTGVAHCGLVVRGYSVPAFLACNLSECVLVSEDLYGSVAALAAFDKISKRTSSGARCSPAHVGRLELGAAIRNVSVSC